MSALADWLDARGLGALHAVLAAQQIDVDVLPDLTEDDLRGLGIALGPRRRLLKAIAGAFLRAIAVRRRPCRRFRRAPPAVGTVRRPRRFDGADARGAIRKRCAEIVRRYQNAVAGEIARFEGYVAKFMGDGVLAYFGWPQGA